MAAKPTLDDRVSRMEAIEARQADATEGEFSLKILRAWSTPDLLRLESILERVEAGDPSVALTAAEQEWIDETMEQASRMSVCSSRATWWGRPSEASQPERRRMCRRL